MLTAFDQLSKMTILPDERLPPQIYGEDESIPISCIPMTQSKGPLKLPATVYGAGTFSGQYNASAHLASSTPALSVRLALRYGICAFDTSPYYGPSESVLGDALDSMKDEFPRSSYQLMTKCGRYGLDVFDYSPVTIRESVKRSLERLKTHYLDTVYLHDVEFVCNRVEPKKTGDHSSALCDAAAAYGLAVDDASFIRGEGDQKILDAFRELRKMQEEGLIRHIGITGYPLPTLLRLSILILHNPPYKPVDVVLSYSHLCLQNSTFTKFASHFYERGKVGQLVAASPFSMGLLTSLPPSWHPAPEGLHAAVAKTRSIWPEGLPNLSLGYSISQAKAAHLPLVVGFSAPPEVHECMKVWRQVEEGIGRHEREVAEQEAINIFRCSDYLDWSWASPGN